LYQAPQCANNGYGVLESIFQSQAVVVLVVARLDGGCGVGVVVVMKLVLVVVACGIYDLSRER
jgi:hypothetical protein